MCVCMYASLLKICKDRLEPKALPDAGVGKVRDGDTLALIPRFNLMWHHPSLQSNGIPRLQPNLQAQVGDVNVTPLVVTERSQDSVALLGVTGVCVEARATIV